MKKESLWEGYRQAKKQDVLPEEAKTDILIIGGGMAGLMLAHRLEKEGADYMLLEAESIGSGVSGKTTAKICATHGFIYSRLFKKYGEQTARLYLDCNLRAVKKIRELSGYIDCDFEACDSYIYSARSKKKVEDERDALARLGADVLYEERPNLPFPTMGAVGLGDQGQVNPMKLMTGLAEGLRIYEGCRVRELVGTTAVTDRGEVRANRIVVATHFPFLNKHGSYFLKMYQHRTYVLALTGVKPTDAMYADESGKGISLRSYGEYLLVGGGSHRTGKRGGGFSELEKFVTEHYSSGRIVYRWATQDCMTLDGIPYVGRYSARTPDLWVATGFNKWGMTGSLAAAEILADGLSGKENKYASLYDPSRSILHPQLAVNAAETVINLLTPTARRCPHLGCALKWNPEEHSWDCPCHGSRFSEGGKLLDNPATGDIDIDK